MENYKEWHLTQTVRSLGNESVSEVLQIVSVQFRRSVTSDSLRPHGLQHARPPCHHQLLEFTQTHVHRVRHAIQKSHSLSTPSSSVFNLSQHQGLFQDGSVQFSRSVVSNSLRPHESQHARPPCHHQLPEFTQIHVHRVSDAIQPSHPLRKCNWKREEYFNSLSDHCR